MTVCPPPLSLCTEDVLLFGAGPCSQTRESPLERSVGPGPLRPGGIGTNGGTAGP
jgi:hypothetical protein